ncbi:MAG TPA: STM3941 family protein, partial [Blastocatellia bacterium]|nr:STM3941 family protein [Blastocatellia bacterium]
MIPLSKKKVSLLILGSALFLGVSIWLWSIAETQDRYNPLFVKGVALASGLFFALCGVSGLTTVFDTRPGLIIDAQGIMDNSSAGSVGRILWCEITALRVAEISGQRFL